MLRPVAWNTSCFQKKIWETRIEGCFSTSRWGQPKSFSRWLKRTARYVGSWPYRFWSFFQGSAPKTCRDPAISPLRRFYLQIQLGYHSFPQALASLPFIPRLLFPSSLHHSEPAASDCTTRPCDHNKLYKGSLSSRRKIQVCSARFRLELAKIKSHFWQHGRRFSPPSFLFLLEEWWFQSSLIINSSWLYNYFTKLLKKMNPIILLLRPP